MDKKLIQEKLESLRRCVRRIQSKRPEKINELEDNLDLQDILSVNLERAVQISVDIAAHILAQTNSEPAETMATTFEHLAKENIIQLSTAISMQKAVGFRNIAVHNYQAINWEIVFNICHKKLDDFKTFAEEINNLLN